MKVIFSVLLMFPFIVSASPFAETPDIPYADQPTSCEFSINSGPNVTGQLVDTGTAFRCYQDVSSVAGTGQANISVVVCNIWGCSTASPLFSFPTGAPSVTSVTGLVLSTP